VQGNIGPGGPKPNDVGTIMCHFTGKDALTVSQHIRMHDILMVDGELEVLDINIGAREGRRGFVQLLIHDLCIIGHAKKGAPSKERMSWPIGLTDEGEVRPDLPPGMGD